MIIRDLPDKIKSQWGIYGQALFVPALLVVVATLSFGLGRLSKIESLKEPVKISYDATPTPPGEAKGEQAVGEGGIKGQVVASKNGTKYHFPWCSGASSIKEENKVWYATEALAIKAGYAKASNCK